MRAEGKGCVMTRRRLEDGGQGRDAGARLGEQGGEQEGEPARSDLGAEAPGGQKVILVTALLDPMAPTSERQDAVTTRLSTLLGTAAVGQARAFYERIVTAGEDRVGM